MNKAQRIRERSQRWFPHYVPVPEEYCALARAVLEPGQHVLHLGAGRDSYSVISRLHVPGLRVVSLDPDRKGLAQNPNPVRIVADGALLPFCASAFDLVLSEDVFEHLEDPCRVLFECYRCLKPGGALVFLCPNRFSYISLISRVTSHRFHTIFKRSCMGVEDSDVFRSYYRLNSSGSIKRVAARVGFRVEILNSYVGWPTYWEFSDVLHRVLVIVHRVLEALPPSCHITLVGVLRRPIN